MRHEMIMRSWRVGKSGETDNHVTWDMLLTTMIGLGVFVFGGNNTCKLSFAVEHDVWGEVGKGGIGLLS